jgi:hypothetical protein
LATLTIRSLALTRAGRPDRPGRRVGVGDARNGVVVGLARRGGEVGGDDAALVLADVGQWPDAGHVADRPQPLASASPSGRVRRRARAPHRRIPGARLAAVKDRVNAIAPAPVDDFRRDSDLFGSGVREPEAQARIRAAFQRGLQTRHAELDFSRVIG